MSPTPQETVVLDAQTCKDLEVFPSSPDQRSLLGLCSFTRTEGGARALRRRMENPWCSVERIRATQQAIVYISSNLPAFEPLQGLSFSANRVDQYLREILPVVVQEGPVEFGLAALSMWVNHERHYSSILLGVQFAGKLVHSLKQFTDRVNVDPTAGELEPMISELCDLLQRARILEVLARDPAGWFWRNVRADQIYRLHEKSTLLRMLEIIHEIDALTAMALATREHGFTMPAVEDGPLAIQATGAWHPFVVQPVVNDIRLDQQQRALFLTGPNMAGKTTYLRTFATLLYFAQLGMGVPAGYCRFSPADRLFCSISLSDDLHNGVSYFRAEALRVRDVAKALSAGYRVAAVMDEPFKGTNVKDAMDASLAVFTRLAECEDCLFVFSSHLIELADELQLKTSIDCRHFGADEQGDRLGFDYRLRPGLSDQRLGMRVLREEGIFDLLDG